MAVATVRTQAMLPANGCREPATDFPTKGRGIFPALSLKKRDPRVKRGGLP